MNWILNLLEDIKWKANEIAWSVEDKIAMWKLNREIAKEEEYVIDTDTEHFEVEEIEVKPKKKKAKKKSVKKTKKSV